MQPRLVITVIVSHLQPIVFFLVPHWLSRRLRYKQQFPVRGMRLIWGLWQHWRLRPLGWGAFLMILCLNYYTDTSHQIAPTRSAIQHCLRSCKAWAHQAYWCGCFLHDITDAVLALLSFN
jgi:hypothetical protein